MPQNLPTNKTAPQKPTNQSSKEKKAAQLIERGNLREAETILREIVASDTANHCSYGNLAAICGMQGRNKEAIQLLKEALKIEDKYPIAHNNLGNALKEQGELDPAINHYRCAIELDPGYADAHYNLGNALREKGLPLQAIKHLRKAIESKPDYAQAHNNIGIILKEEGDLAEAIKSYKAAITLSPNFADAQINLGNALLELGNTSDAISHYQRGIKLKPRLATAQIDLGVAFMSGGKVEEALSSLRKALDLEPDNADAHWNYSLTLLLKGDYKNGWASYERRFEDPRKIRKPHASPSCERWSGDLSSKPRRLLLVSEQGIGDTLQFMRYASTIKEEGIDITLCAQEKLHSLIQASGIDPNPITPDQADLARDGKWIPLLSLPKQLSVSPTNAVHTKPYIKATNNLTEKWKEILSKEQRPIIAINWQGNPAPETRGLRGRSFELEKLAPIANLNASLLSIQKGFGSDQLENCTFKDHFVSCQEMVNKTWDFLETAAIIANCDLVITSDTYLAHLAGGMGKNTWLLLHQVPDWRWGLEGDTTFWYPSVRLFRQKERGNWNEVMVRVAEALQEHFGSSSTPSKPAPARQPSNKPVPIQDILAPISLGELIDKITILQIKTHQLQGAALENAKKELEALEGTLNNLKLKIDPTLIQRLKEVNLDLWKIEDDIRQQESEKRFGETFIRLARSVYQQNDCRAAIKKEINTTYGSAFVEEKSYREYTHQDLQEETILKTQNRSAWETLAITLEPTGQRYLDFKSNNKHLEITAYAATRGTDITKQEAARRGIATEELLATALLTPGALGCAASHRAIWEKCSNSNKGFLVMEDDCFTHPEINKFIAKHLEKLMSADICFFGINTDSIIQSRPLSNLSRISLFHPKHPSQDWIRNALSKTDIRNVEIQKLEKAFGFYAYFISPKGAQKLNEAIFPLSLKATNIPLITEKMRAISIDRSGCAIYSQLDALVCEPFLAYTPNTDSSTKSDLIS